jgi:hypothetical protein
VIETVTSYLANADGAFWIILAAVIFLTAVVIWFHWMMHRDPYTDDFDRMLSRFFIGCWLFMVLIFVLYIEGVDDDVMGFLLIGMLVIPFLLSGNGGRRLHTPEYIKYRESKNDE